jgi:hypothetical protein
VPVITNGIPPPVKLESNHMTYIVLVALKIQHQQQQRKKQQHILVKV